MLLCSLLLGDPPFTIVDTTVPATTGDALVSSFYNDIATANPQVAQQIAAQLQQDVVSAFGNLVGPLQNQINQKITTLHFGPFLQAFANALTLAGKGCPADYATDMSLFSLTVGPTIATSGFNIFDIQNTVSKFQNTTNLPAEGLGLNLTILLGINLHMLHLPDMVFFEPRRLSVYLSYSNFSAPQSLLNNIGSGIALQFKSIGAHLQYHLISQKNLLTDSVVQWGGIYLGTGFNYALQDFSYTYAFSAAKQSQNINAPLGRALTAQLSWGGSSNNSTSIKINTNSLSIPFEITTHMQILYFLTLYGGLGIDANFGSAKVTAISNVPADLSVFNNTGTAVKIANPIAKINFKQSSGPTVGDGRTFFGLQFNAFLMAVFAQISIDTTLSYGANIGVRFFW